MSAVFADEGCAELLGVMLNKVSQGNVKLKLFVNNYTPLKSTVLADLTECTLTGYAALTLTGSSWTITTASNVSVASYAAQTFTFSASGQTIYGYYFTNNGSTKLLWAERLGTSYAVPSGGGSITIIPSVADKDCP